MRVFNRLKKHQWCRFVVSILITVVLSGLLLYREKYMKVHYKINTYLGTTPNYLVSVSHVTKSLKELGKMDSVNKYLLFLNQIPNCGAEVLILLLQKLQGVNSYRHVHLKGVEKNELTLAAQKEIIDEFYSVTEEAAVPLSVDRHVRFINFTSFDKQLPTFFNLVRDPADMIFSRSTYTNDSVTLTKCLIKGRKYCDNLMKSTKYLSIPYFCGYDRKCSLLNHEWAFETAKVNVEKYYKVVGILEEMNTTLAVLEHSLPFFFKGVQNTYAGNLLRENVAGNTYTRKVLVDSKAREQLKRMLGREFEFYEWIRQRLFQQLQVIYGNNHSH